MNSDVEINQAAQLKSIDEIVKSLDIKIDDLFFYGPYQAKLKPSFTNTLKEYKTSKLILVMEKYLHVQSGNLTPTHFATFYNEKDVLDLVIN